MGRKNKIKLMKHGSPSSLVTASMSDSGYFGSVIGNERHDLDPEVMRTNLSELVDGPEEFRAQKLQFVQSEFDKKSAELAVARKIIKQFQREFHCIGTTSAGESDADSSLNDDFLAKTRENEECTNRLIKLRDALEPIGEKQEELDQREALSSQLQAAQDNVRHLEEQVAGLERDLQTTSDALKARESESLESEKRSNSKIRDLEASLLESNKNIEKTNSLSQKNADALLQLEKSRDYCHKIENELVNYKRQVEALKSATVNRDDFQKEVDQFKNTCKQLEERLKEKEDSRLELVKSLGESKKECDKMAEKIRVLTTELDNYVKNEVVLKARIESLNIDCIDAVKTLEAEQEHLVQVEQDLKTCTAEKDRAVSEWTAASEMVEKLQKQIEELNKRPDVSEQLQTVLERERQLKAIYEARYESINNGVQQIKRDFSIYKVEHANVIKQNEELQHKIISAKADTKYYKDDGDHCRKYIKKLEEQAIDFKKAMVSEKEVALEKELEAVKSELHNELDSKEVASILDAVRMFKKNCEEQRNQYIASSNELVEAQSVNVELKTKVDELQESCQKLNDETKKLAEEKKKLADEIATSKNLVKKARKDSDNTMMKMKKKFDALQSENNSLIAKTKEYEEALSEVTNSSGSNNDSLQSEKTESAPPPAATSEILELQEKLTKCLNDLEEKTKTISTQEVRINELRRSTCSLQQRFETDLVSIRGKLEAAEDALGVQQEMNAKKEASTEEIKQKHSSELKNLERESEQLKETVKKYTETMEKMRSDHLELVKLMQADMQAMEAAKQQASEESVVLKNSVFELTAKLEAAQADLDRVQAKLEAQPTVVENPSDSEKDQMRQENDKLKQKLESSEKALNEQKTAAKKHLDNQLRKQKKLTKDAENGRREAESERQRAEEAYKMLTAEVDELKDLVQVVRADDQSKLSEMKVKLEKETAEVESLRQLVEKLKSEGTDQKDEEFRKLYTEKYVLQSQYDKLADNIDALGKKMNLADCDVTEENLFTVLERQLQEQNAKLLETKSALATVSEGKSELEKEQQQLKKMADDCKVENSKLKERIVILENQNADLVTEHAKERSGLVTELCTAIEKNAGFENNGKISSDRIQMLEKQLKSVQEEHNKQIKLHEQASGHVVDKLDEMFPDWNPSARHLARLFIEDTNVQYGALGVLAYAILIHLYILF